LLFQNLLIYNILIDSIICIVFVHGFIDEIDFEGLFDVILFLEVTFEIENGDRLRELFEHITFINISINYDNEYIKYTFMILILEPIWILKSFLE